MILIEETNVIGIEDAIRGMRNPMNSWDKSDSGLCKGGDSGIGCQNCAAHECGHTYDHSFQIGKSDYDLMMKLAKGGSVHGKYRRMIVVYVDITAPLYWWKEFDTYKIGTVANSCSTMHKIHSKEFELDDFSHEHLFPASSPCAFVLDGTDIGVGGIGLLALSINLLNAYRKRFNEEKDPDMKKLYWWPMIQLLPSSYNQKRTVMLNYEVLAGIYQHRKDHKLDEWRHLCRWIEELPHSELISCGVGG